MPEVPALPRPSGLAAAVAEAFADDGRLAQVVPEFEPRDGQRAMAALVADTIARGGIALAEAGTGTGKTLAYLVPAILSRRRVLVSTGTKNLQEQIFFKDLPVLREALGVPFSAAYMKGRANYLCLHRFSTFRAAASPLPLDDRSLVSVLDEWASRTETGDRAEVDVLPEEWPHWSEIAATSENCVGAECPRHQDCFVTRMRDRAAVSDLVIVNHHLLCADAAVRQGAYGSVLPDCDCAVIDEAHQLEDVMTQHFGISVSNHRLEELAHDVEPLCGNLSTGDAEGELRARISRLRQRTQLFFQALAVHLAGTPEGGPRPTVPGRDERVRVRPDVLVPASPHGARLIEALDGLEATLALVRDANQDVLALARRAGELRDELRFLVRASDPDHVFYIEARGRGVLLRASPIDVSALAREMLFDRMHATVLTSATLSVDGSFEYVRSRLGVRRATGLRLPSEFDYARQAILYLPASMPDPRSPGFATAVGREVSDIVRRTRGRAFILFTSYSVLRNVHAMLESTVEYPIFVQGSAPRSTLLAHFRSTPHAVLLATSSFWQGVDVVGEALSCVVIDRLPFASPGDPLTAARIEAINARGGDAFAEYQVPLAILMLLQGLGRLIRHRRDRGALAVLDPRVRTMAYGPRFLASLPPAPVTSALDDIERFFAE